MDKLLSTASMSDVKIIRIPKFQEEGIIEVMVTEPNQEMLSKCKSVCNDEIIYEMDVGWSNRCGYQAFGIDEYTHKKDGYTVNKYMSDYNVFYSIGKYMHNIGYHDLVRISTWEGIFWPGAYNKSHSKLRDIVGEVVIELTGKSRDCTIMTMYTDKYTIKFEGEGQYIQRAFTIALTVLYDIYIEECNQLWEDYTEVYNTLKSNG